MRHKYYIILLALIVLGACTGKIPLNTVDGFSYGKFCGFSYGKTVGHKLPDDAHLSQQQRIANRLAVPAHDDIDQACKNHDICFIAKGERNFDCNSDLILELKNHNNAYIGESRFVEKCKSVIYMIYSYAASFSSGSSNSKGETDFYAVAAKILAMPQRILNTIFYSPNYLLAGFPDANERCMVNK